MPQKTRLVLVLAAALGSFSCSVPQYSFNNSKEAGPEASGGTGGKTSDGGDSSTKDGGPCQSNADCTATTATPVCDTGSGACVECRPTASDCADGTYCGPDPNKPNDPTNHCLQGCNSDADCNKATVDAGREGGTDGGDASTDSGDASTGTDAGTHLTCDIVNHVCIGCKDLGDCPAGSICDLKSGQCKSGCNDKAPCPTGQACCNNTCANVFTDNANCGSCGNACAPANGTGTCNNGSCEIASCNPGYNDCNSTYTDGCESNQNQDPVNCGQCGNTCSLAHATAKCTSGTCDVASCDTGYTDCNNDPSDGCEAQLDSDATNCGACGKICSTNHSTPTCTSGVCGVNCDAGFDDCNSDPTDGCETNLNISVDNCSACGKVCPATGGTPNCVSGKCGISQCTGSLADCDGLSSNGCEADISTDLNNCGKCGNTCSAANATVACTSGSCGITGCSTNFADCNNQYTDGCEANLKSDVNNCSGCGNVCSSTNGTPSCNQGLCSITCNAGFDDCDGKVSNGCETPLDTVSNCGTCGVACTNAHGTTSCTGGVCKPICAAGWADCNGDPTDGCETPLNTNANCGGCGTACAPSNATGDCSTGSCAVGTCNSGWGNCDGNAGNGCETHTATDVANCGGCGSACSNNNGSPSCSGGGCGIACSSGYANCDGDARTNGCEVNTNTDPTHCGSCTNSCSASTPNCSNGSCISACAAGTADCDGNSANGCETNIASDGNHCGSCTKTCNSSQYCNGGNCSSCSSGHSDCDKDGTNACESATASDPNNCGGCGTRCGLDGTCGCSSSSCSGGTIYFSEDFSDNSRGWTMQGTWAIGPTSTSSGQEEGFPDPANDHSTTSDNGVAGIVLGGNYSYSTHSAWYLTSPAIDLSGAGSTVNLTFWRWLNCDSTPYTTDTVEVYDGSWHTLWTNPGNNNLVTDAAWTRETFNVSSYKSATFKVRFGFAVGTKGAFRAWIMSGWNIDDLSLSSGTCN